MKRTGQQQIGSFFKKVKPDSLPKPAFAQVSNGAVSSSVGSSVGSTGSGGSSSNGFSKQAWIASLTSEQKELLQLEIDTLEESWLAALYKELTKPYFLQLKRFLATEYKTKTIFPPQEDIYSWSRLTKLSNVRVVILGQDPYHNHNQAHGLAFSVRPPAVAPPSLVNIFKELKNCYPDFQRPPGNSGLLTPWSTQGVLMLNACLTVEAHKANSHAKKGWEQFTEQVLKAVLDNSPKGVCFMSWGIPASKRIEKIRPGPSNIILRSAHPSPLAAGRGGWFGTAHFKKANDWLQEKYGETIDWSFKPKPKQTPTEAEGPAKAEEPAKVVPETASSEPQQNGLVTEKKPAPGKKIAELAKKLADEDDDLDDLDLSAAKSSQ